MATLVDANVHVIGADRQRYPVAPRRGTLPAWAEGSTEELLSHMQAANVDQAVLVHSAAIYGNDTRYTLDSAQRHPDCLAALVGVDVADPDALDTLIRFAEQHHVAGVRFEPGDAHAADWLLAAKTVRLWQEAAARRLFVSLPSVRTLEAVPTLRRVLEQFSTVPVILRQLLGVSPDRVEDVFALADLPNVYFTFSLQNIDTARQSASGVELLFGAFIDHFGADHLLWGSFYPAHRGTLEAPYAGVIDQVRNALSFVSEADRDWLLGETARTLFPTLLRR
jgi:predicted TIM-barrel fold metal-dependent hydrolase